MTLKCPSNHSQTSVVVILPPGPIGPGFISPVPVHLPTKKPSRSFSGPGLGAGGACAAANWALTDTAIQAMSMLDDRLMVGPPSSGQDFSGPENMQAPFGMRQAIYERATQIETRQHARPNRHPVMQLCHRSLVYLDHHEPGRRLGGRRLD